MNCGICGEGFHPTDESNRMALEEMQQRFGDIPEEERVTVCNDCDRWMQDVERIARAICRDNNLDPEVMVTKMTASFEPYEVPTWMAFIPEARAQTTIPSPGQRRPIPH